MVFFQAEKGGGGGSVDYTDLTNKPQINGNELSGNKTASQLGLIPVSALNDLIIVSPTVRTYTTLPSNTSWYPISFGSDTIAGYKAICLVNIYANQPESIINLYNWYTNTGGTPSSPDDIIVSGYCDTHDLQEKIITIVAYVLYIKKSI